MRNISGEFNGAPRSGRSSLDGDGFDAAMLEAMVEGASEGLVLLSSDGLILRANRAAVEMIGHERNQIIGLPIQGVLFKASFEASFIGEVVAKNLAVSRTHDLPDGRSIHVTGRPVTAGVARVVLVLCDVTNMKQLVSRADRVAHESKPAWTEMRSTGTKAADGTQVVARSVVMQAVRDRALQCASVDSPVLLLGETGTGKNVFAKFIHEASSRYAGPFYVVNCGAIPEGLLEAELFGYARGAFTGADPRGKVGLIELANAGTLLLDEIGDLPLGLQVKLLRFLESGEIWPIGASRGKRPDVRIIAATNCDVSQMIADGRFRKDLYYRLHVLSIRIPPLREHPEDIPWLVAMILDQLARRLGTRKRIGPNTLEAICQLPLPGNVRELWNLVESLAVTVPTEIIETTDLREHAGAASGAWPAALPKPENGNLRETLRKIEEQLLREALERHGTQSKAARHLGVGQATIARKSKRYGIGA